MAWDSFVLCVTFLLQRKKIFACTDFPVSSGRSIYLLKRCLQSFQSLLWVSTLPEMGCKKKTGCLWLLFTVMRGYFLWLFILVLGLDLTRPTGIFFSLRNGWYDFATKLLCLSGFRCINNGKYRVSFTLGLALIQSISVKIISVFALMFCSCAIMLWSPEISLTLNHNCFVNELVSWHEIWPHFIAQIMGK